MNTLPLLALTGLLALLIILSAFFSASETAMMALNRYRLRTLAQSGNKRAAIAMKLLEKPERLLGTILLGNNLVNMAAAAVSTLLAIKLYGEAAIAIATLIMTGLILVLAEVPPKTYAALNPEKVAFPAAPVLSFLIKLFNPIVSMINLTGSTLVKLLGGSFDSKKEHLSPEELRTVVLESGSMIPQAHRDMLLHILELESISVDDVMVPRSKIAAIDFEDDWDDIVIQLSNSPHTRIPAYEGNLNNIIGLIHVRKILHLMNKDELNIDSLKSVLREPYFIPEGSKLSEQLIALQRVRHQTGLVVDEYGEIVGLVTVEEILEQIVGKFTDQMPGQDLEIYTEDDGNLIIPGNAYVRELNRRLNWQLPTHGPKTLNGLIVEQMENIPVSGTRFILHDLEMQVLQSQDTAVAVVRVKQ